MSSAPDDDQTSRPYGPDPDLNNPRVTWAKTLTREQRETLTVVGDLIIPADDGSPAASTFDIADFIDEWVSAPYPEQQRDRGIILAGLAGLDDQAQARGVPCFRELPAGQQLALFEALAAELREQRATDARAQFFTRLVCLFVSGFYTTQAGMADLGYVGNVKRDSFSGPSLAVREKLGV